MNILKVLTERRKRGNLGERLAARHLKKNGYKISCELSKQYGLYRQDYCGCEFSRAARP